MKCRTVMQGISLFLASSIALVGCSGNKVELRSQTDFQEVDVATLQFPLQETTTIKGMTTFPANTESNPNNRTIFKRLQEATNVEVEWTAIKRTSDGRYQAVADEGENGFTAEKAAAFLNTVYTPVFTTSE